MAETLELEIDEIDNRPELPDIFPDRDVRVEGEEHQFLAAETDNNNVEYQYDYVPNKAPVTEIESIQGVDTNGDSRTFSNGIDYELVEYTTGKTDTFTFELGKGAYLMTYESNLGTVVVDDEFDNTYSQGTDYEINSPDSHFGDVLSWIEGGDSPDENVTFFVSYETTFDESLIRWQQDADHIPQGNSTFYVTYRADSLIGRYVNSGEEELDKVEKTLQQSIKNKFIDQAEGDKLDEIGKLFGSTIGKRRGREDPDYRTYLKSVVQSFTSRGTVNGIKLAISAATGIPIDDIAINEDFQRNEYDVTITPQTPVTGSLIEEIAEVADPSGVRLGATRFKLLDEATGIADDVSATLGEQIGDILYIDDTAVVGDTDGNTIDIVGTKDTISLPAPAGDTLDTVEVDDGNTILARETADWDDGVSGLTRWNFFEWAPFVIPDADVIASASDALGTSDGATFGQQTINTFDWDDGTGSLANWNFFEWTATVIPDADVVAQATDDLAIDDANVYATADINTAVWDDGTGTHKWDFFEWTAFEIPEADVELSASEVLGSADIAGYTSSNIDKATWDDGTGDETWDFFEWTKAIVEADVITDAGIDTLASDDGVTADPTAIDTFKWDDGTGAINTWNFFEWTAFIVTEPDVAVQDMESVGTTDEVFTGTKPSGEGNWALTGDTDTGVDWDFFEWVESNPA